MISTIISFIPQTLAPYFIEKWKSGTTRADVWLELAEIRYNKKWTFEIYKEYCSPRVTRFAYGCRWNKISSIQKSHKEKGRLVIDGHFSYMVRDDLAMQSRCFSFDEALLTSLLVDKIIEKKIFGKIKHKKLLQFSRILHDYFWR